MYETWNCESCGITIIEVDYDYDLHMFEVYKGDDLLGKITPATIEDLDRCRSDLDNGFCPICDGWEDGNGNLCVMDGWGN